MAGSKTRIRAVAGLVVLVVGNPGCTTLRAVIHPKPRIEVGHTDSSANAERAAAGASSFDLMPPLGRVLGGHGPNGLTAMGRRGELGCQVVYLADQEGDALAWVTCDLPFTSTALQRRVAAALAESTTAPARCKALGSDRIAISSTHTHAGPGSHFVEGAYAALNPFELDAFRPRDSSYDPVYAAFLAGQIAAGVEEACRDADAGLDDDPKVRWLDTTMGAVTRNRSVVAHCANGTPAEPGCDCAASLAPTEHTDRRMQILQVFRGEPTQTVALMAFVAVHPTAVPSGADVYHADLFGEARMALRGAGAPWTTKPVIAFVNGAEGDVSPAWPGQPGRSGAGFELAREIGAMLADAVLAATKPEAPAAVDIDIRHAHADVGLAGSPRIDEALGACGA